jgi:hypothetical protein
VLNLTIGLVCEGTSDKPLLSVLRTLVIAAGATRVSGEAIALTGTVQSKIDSVLKGGGKYDLLFVHRDSDSRDHEPRYQEIRGAAQSAGWQNPLVCVVPVHTTEAWLLTDEAAIRDVAGKRTGRVALGLPQLGAIERTADPKSTLRNAYLAATEASGRRRNTAERLFNQRRAALLERLDVSGKVAQLPSFQRLVQDVADAVSGLQRQGG